MCKAKDCKWYKECIVKRELIGDTKCSDYKKKEVTNNGKNNR